MYIDGLNGIENALQNIADSIGWVAFVLFISGGISFTTNIISSKKKKKEAESDE